jgi:hypothetical protein
MWDGNVRQRRIKSKRNVMSEYAETTLYSPFFVQQRQRNLTIKKE